MVHTMRRQYLTSVWWTRVSSWGSDGDHCALCTAVQRAHNGFLSSNVWKKNWLWFVFVFSKSTITMCWIIDWGSAGDLHNCPTATSIISHQSHRSKNDSKLICCLAIFFFNPSLPLLVVSQISARTFKLKEHWMRPQMNKTLPIIAANSPTK